VERVPERSCSEVVKGSGDIFGAIRSRCYEIYVGDKLSEGDVLEALSEGRNGQVTPVET